MGLFSTNKSLYSVMFSKFCYHTVLGYVMFTCSSWYQICSNGVNFSDVCPWRVVHMYIYEHVWRCCSKCTVPNKMAAVPHQDQVICWLKHLKLNSAPLFCVYMCWTAPLNMVVLVLFSPLVLIQHCLQNVLLCSLLYVSNVIILLFFMLFCNHVHWYLLTLGGFYCLLRDVQQYAWKMEVCVVGTFEESCVNQFSYMENVNIKFLQWIWILLLVLSRFIFESITVGWCICCRIMWTVFITVINLNQGWANVAM